MNQALVIILSSAIVGAGLDLMIEGQIYSALKAAIIFGGAALFINRNWPEKKTAKLTAVKSSPIRKKRIAAVK